MRDSFKPQILDEQLGSLPLGPIVNQQTSEIVAQGNTVLAFLMDEDCPFELVADESAMAKYSFFEEDWKNKPEWVAKYTFPGSDKEFKAQMMQIDRGDGVKV